MIPALMSRCKLIWSCDSSRSVGFASDGFRAPKGGTRRAAILAGQGPGGGDIAVHLTYELVHRIEGALVAQLGVELHAQHLAVEIALEVQEIRLDSDRGGGRPPPEWGIDPRARGGGRGRGVPPRPARIDAPRGAGQG